MGKGSSRYKVSSSAFKNDFDVMCRRPLQSRHLDTVRTESRQYEADLDTASQALNRAADDIQYAKWLVEASI